MASLLTGIAAGIGKGALSLVAKDRNILIPLDAINKTQVITDENLKKQFCEDDVSLKEITGLKEQLSKVSDIVKGLDNPEKAVLTGLEKVLKRLDRL